MEKILCKIRTTQDEVLVGEVDKNQLKAPINEFISIGNKAVHKSEVEEIILYRAYKHLTFDRESLGLNALIII